MTKYNVCGIGNALVDYEVIVNDDFLNQFEIEKGMMTLVEKERQEELVEAVKGNIKKKQSGGSAANSIIALAQLGGTAFYSCKVANDEDGNMYQEEMKDYVPTEEEGGRKKKAKKDPNAPKRNMSAYFLYSMFARPQVKEDNPDASFGDIARIISQQFKDLSDKEKKKWERKAAEDKERYQREMAAYNA